MRQIGCETVRWTGSRRIVVWLFWLSLLAACARHSPPPLRPASAPPSLGPPSLGPRSAPAARPSEGRAASNLVELDETNTELQSSDDPLQFAESESAFSCPDRQSMNDPEKPATWRSALARLHVTRPARLWASIGPASSLRGKERSLLLLVRLAEDGTLAPAACGAAWGVDLEPGHYLIYGATRTRQNNDSVPGFLYRVSQVGDRSCAAELATRGVHDWNGEFPFSVQPAADLNGDGTPDLAVTYQYAYLNPGTRLLVSTPYPECYRIVLDEASAVQLRRTRTRGWRDIELHYWSLHPDPFFGGRMTVSFAGRYDPQLGGYAPFRFDRCADGFPENQSDTALRERLCNSHYRAAPPLSLLDQIERWLASAPAERPVWDLGEPGRALLDAIDERGMRFSLEPEDECPARGDTRVFTANLKLRSDTDSEQSWTRELFVNFELRAHETIARVTSVSDSSPCPVAPQAPEALDYVSEWLAAGPTRTNAPNLSSARSRLRRALQADRLRISDVRSCASEPQNPTWLWSAQLSSGSADDSIDTPFYLRLSAPQGHWQVLAVSSVAPPQCPLR
jgi:hypothetical protein